MMIKIIMMDLEVKLLWMIIQLIKLYKIFKLKKDVNNKQGY
jgi:hypothetical protein